MEKEKWTLVQEKVYCKNCVRWYSTGADQCEIPSCGITSNDRENTSEFRKATGKQKYIDKSGQSFIKSHLKRISFCNSNYSMIYGHPTKLNANNDCYFYKTLPKCLRWLTPIVRMFQC